MRIQIAVVVALASAVIGRAQSQAPAKAPTVDQILSLKRAGAPQISPDGRLVAYTVQETNWDDNAYETEIWVADAQSGATRQLTNGKKSSSAPAWAPDSTRLAFISDRTDTRQIYVIDARAGEADKLTDGDAGIGAFAWSPDGLHIAYTATAPKSQDIKDRDKKYGEFQIVETDQRMSQLFVIDVATKKSRPLTLGSKFTVGRFSWSPDSKTIAFDHQVNPSPGSSGTSDISVVTVADAAIRPLITQDGPDTHPVWSPDGSRIAFETAMANPYPSFTNHPIAVVPATGGTPTVLTASFDEDPNIVAWKTDGLYFTASERTYSYLYKLDVTTHAIAKVNPVERMVTNGCSLSADAKIQACLRSSATSMAEVFVGSRKITSLNDQTNGWPLGTLEVIDWKSQDGATIEGVLHKPADFNPSTKYPLLVVIHGGPTGTSRAIPLTSNIYSIDVWVPRGVLVLEPNYRGSAGYGEKFRSLNVRNLGVGDAWDVLSGVDSLIAKGVVDRDRVGVMGWSQGGYISAFLATHDAARFKAISVGAGISDWMTYYVNTDIHPFTRQYLKATPWDDPEIYAKTSPITYIKGAKTPTLIQHGATDQRVPLPNAYELYQGLQDNHVPSKLIVYQGFGGIGHGPSKPKSHRATMDHNLEWFDQYLFTSTRPQS
ncbi:MAG TPA: S9 family peptidase [Vicinamibacterales bacterium]|nr:S9 family peptidase [Vicinamibacterales bacterium]